MTHLALILALVLGCALEPFPPGTPTARIQFIDVGQGESTLVISPTGRTLLIDGGVDGMGNSRIVPLLKGLGIKRLDHMVATHWHPDHVGGLDEVIKAGFAPTRAWDRGDVRRPTYTSVSAYLAAVGSGRSTLTPGTTIDLGGGMSALCVAANGQVHQGPTDSFAGRNQEENGRSIALRIRYGGFDMWAGGDLTGGGSGTADVEGPAATACGDVDLYLANHHGSNTSSSQTFLARIRPECALFSAGAANSYGHPTSTVLGRCSPVGAVIPLLCTTTGAGARGVIAAGTVALETDGYLYALTAKGQRWTLAVDSRPGLAPVGVAYG